MKVKCKNAFQAQQSNEDDVLAKFANGEMNLSDLATLARRCIDQAEWQRRISAPNS